jgi:hypothetical protein
MMYEFIQAGELRAEAKRLLRYRLPLILAILVNFAFLVRAPIAGMRAENAPPQNVETTTPEPTGPTAAARTPRSSARVSAANQNATHQHVKVAPAAAAAASVPNQLAPPTTSPSPRSAGVSPFSFTSAWGPTGQRLFARWSVPLRQSAPAPAPAVLPRSNAAPDSTTAPRTTATPEPLVATQTAPALPSHPNDGPKTLPAPQPASPPTVGASPPTALTIRNARENEGPVSFLVNGRVCELQPGEAHEFAAGTSWNVQFHRGESFGNAEQTLGPGTFCFVVTDQGWDLEAAPSGPPESGGARH